MLTNQERERLEIVLVAEPGASDAVRLQTLIRVVEDILTDHYSTPVGGSPLDVT